MLGKKMVLSTFWADFVLHKEEDGIYLWGQELCWGIMGPPSHHLWKIYRGNLVVMETQGAGWQQSYLGKPGWLCGDQGRNLEEGVVWRWSLPGLLKGLWTGRGFADAFGLERGLCPESLACFARMEAAAGGPPGASLGSALGRGQPDQRAKDTADAQRRPQ